jgi:hypothetical protein
MLVGDLGTIRRLVQCVAGGGPRRPASVVGR